jgi:uncharacterized membrane protein
MAEATIDLKAGPAAFHAVLMPHRALGDVGFAVIVGAVGFAGFLAGIGFYLAGAWPVLGFLGVDVALLWLAFRVHRRRQRAFETLVLDHGHLTVTRVDATGRARAVTFPAAWVRIESAGDERPGLRLRSHGRDVVVGRFLAEGERDALVDALRLAIARDAAPHRTDRAT